MKKCLANFANTASLRARTATAPISAMQQMSISFGVASASLVTAFFLPDRYRANPPQFIHGIHRAFFVLGAMTVLSTIVFGGLKRGDGDLVSQRNARGIGLDLPGFARQERSESEAQRQGRRISVNMSWGGEAVKGFLVALVIIPPVVKAS